jgi:hypothetical protein
VRRHKEKERKIGRCRDREILNEWKQREREKERKINFSLKVQGILAKRDGSYT